MTHGTTRRRRRDATWLVALGAALWGSDALLRLPLVDRSYPASTIVFLEHVVIVLVTLPWVLPALRAFSGSSARTKAAVLVIGAGASALATVLFTQAFVYAPQDSAAITPVVLQKLQPVIAVMVAWWLLKERVTLRYPLFLVPALAGAWLLAFPNPLEVSVAAGLAAGLAVGAAALWATGTVLGRMVGAEIGLRDLTVLRFLFGLPASLVLVLALGDPLTVELQDTPVVVALGLIPGLLAIALYYRGLRSTPASRATLAELAFPLTAAVVGVAFLGSTLTGTQWLGARRRRRGRHRPGAARAVLAAQGRRHARRRSRRPCPSRPTRRDRAGRLPRRPGHRRLPRHRCRRGAGVRRARRPGGRPLPRRPRQGGAGARPPARRRATCWCRATWPTRPPCRTSCRRPPAGSDGSTCW